MLIFVVLVLPLFPLVPGAGNYFAGPWDAGLQGEFHVQKQSLADGVQPYLLTLVPMAIGGALILSRRQLKNGSNRPLYPAFWRRMGYVFFWLPVALLVYVLVLAARGELELY